MAEQRIGLVFDPSQGRGGGRGRKERGRQRGGGRGEGRGIRRGLTLREGSRSHHENTPGAERNKSILQCKRGDFGWEAARLG